MKLNKSKTNATVTFESIHIGETFRLGQRHYMKITWADGSTRDYAVNLETGAVEGFAYATNVLPVEICAEIKNYGMPLPELPK